MDWLNLLIENAGLWRTVISVISGVLLSIPVWVMSKGGTKALKSKLAGCDTDQRNAALAKVKRGLELRSKDVATNEEVNSLLAGLDEWRTLNSTASSRINNLERLPKVYVALMLLCGIVWACRLFAKGDGYTGATAIVLWMLCFGYFLMLAGPVFMALAQHGSPNSSATSD